MDCPYFEVLNEVRKFLESRIEIFPVAACEDATRFLKLLLGLEEVGGYFDPKKTIYGLIGVPHAWSLDFKGEFYVDLTMDQFGKYPPVYLLPLDTKLLIKDEGLNKIHCSLKTSNINPHLEELFCEFKKE